MCLFKIWKNPVNFSAFTNSITFLIVQLSSIHQGILLELGELLIPSVETPPLIKQSSEKKVKLFPFDNRNILCKEERVPTDTFYLRVPSKLKELTFSFFFKIYHIKEYYYLHYCLFSVLCASSLNNMFSKGPILQILLHLINFTFMFSPFEVKCIRKMNASNRNIIWRIRSGI